MRKKKDVRKMVRVKKKVGMSSNIVVVLALVMVLVFWGSEKVW